MPINLSHARAVREHRLFRALPTAAQRKLLPKLAAMVTSAQIAERSDDSELESLADAVVSLALNPGQCA